MQNNRNPKFIFCLSGKRKSGKDYVAALMNERFGDQSVIVRLSGPLKCQYAKEHGLDYDKLLDSTSYKEDYRQDMIRWGEEIRNKDPGYFCRHACEQSMAFDKLIWIVSDARRPTDIAYFKDNFGGCGSTAVLTVRINARSEVRRSRGWAFTKGIDDVESECALDDFSDWNFVLENNDISLGNNVEVFLRDVAGFISTAQC